MWPGEWPVVRMVRKRREPISRIASSSSRRSTAQLPPHIARSAAPSSSKRQSSGHLHVELGQVPPDVLDPAGIDVVRGDPQVGKGLTEPRVAARK